VTDCGGEESRMEVEGRWLADSNSEAPKAAQQRPPIAK
jgi:hypothetical protein